MDVKPDGSFRLNQDYFAYTTGLTMTNERFHALFGEERAADILAAAPVSRAIPATVAASLR